MPSRKEEMEQARLRFDAEMHCVWRGDEEIRLTPSEAHLLRVLLAKPGRPVSTDDLLVEALGYPRGTGSPEIVRTHLTGLRTKLEDRAAPNRFIVCRARVGYLAKGFDVDSPGSVPVQPASLEERLAAVESEIAELRSQLAGAGSVAGSR
jgi:DNA-binding winged helix-turn-helix (wHTH) protein